MIFHFKIQSIHIVLIHILSDYIVDFLAAVCSEELFVFIWYSEQV